ncbi:SLAP domain-containing protein [Oceanobacillus salinisoli]|uniref:SLAP domain-containing protein n=1 Tax=Oceanobacillus salinisoli TaxID=2678611 RepID=UPI0018CBF9E8|nr:SLAP domain-containing protein [Oceanobacillus salinisoli]
MVQKLEFESAWDRTVAEQDREKIKQAFSQAKKQLSDDESIQFTPLKSALNHKGELLVTTLVHNTTGEGFSFLQHEISFQQNGHTIATHVFSTPSLWIEKKTSMPWTFIFPEHQIDRHKIPENGILILVK